LKLTGGIRFTQDRTANTNNLITYNFGGFTGPPAPVNQYCTIASTQTPPGCDVHYLERSHAPTWLVDLDYTPWEDFLTYAKYSRGYREGVVNPAVPPPYNYAGPEKLDAYEIGAKTSFEGPVPGTFDIAGFYNEFSNQQLQLGFSANPCYYNYGPAEPCAPAPIGPASADLNAGSSRSEGIELETTLHPYEGVAFDIAYTYLDTRITKANPITPCTPYDVAEPVCGIGGQAVGDPLPLSPKNKVSLTGAYTLPLDDKFGKITLSATFTHTDRQLTTYENASATGLFNNANDPQILGLDYIQPTNILDLNLNWDEIASQPIDLSIFATNVTGDKYYTFIAGLGASTGFETANIGQPAMYGIRLKYRFGEE
jgi:iron complex outermembrane receptor protein